MRSSDKNGGDKKRWCLSELSHNNNGVVCKGYKKSLALHSQYSYLPVVSACSSPIWATFYVFFCSLESDTDARLNG